MVRMTGEEFDDFCKRHSLRHSDAGWLCGGKTRRQTSNWRHSGVTGSSALILMAYDEGLIPPEWFAKHIDVSKIDR